MQVLPANPLAAHLGSPTPPVGAKLSPNPLTAHLAGTAAPVALQAHAPVVPSVKPGIDPTISNPAANVTPAPGQRSGEAVAQRAALTQTPHGGATGMLGEWVGPNMAHLLTTGHVGSGGAAGLGVDALGLLPFGKLAKGVKLGVDVVRAGRTAEEATAHLGEVAAKAAAESGHSAPVVERGVATPETGGHLGQQVRESLVGREAKLPTSVEPRVFPVKRDPVTGRSYPSGETHREYYHLMPKGDYLYHSTGSDSFAGIRAEGLKPGKERLGEPTGVYFAEKGSGVTILRPSNDRIGDVLLRVKRGDVLTQVTDTFEHGSGFEEHVSSKAVPASHLEYLGADHQWHPVSEPSHALTHLPSAAEIRAVQKEGYSVERGKRAAEAKLAGEQVGGGLAGHYAENAVLKGSLARESFPHLTHLDDTHLHELLQHVDRSPLQFYEQKTAKSALEQMIHDGTPPTESEQTLLERVFGKVSSPVVPATLPASSFWDKFVSYTNIPRAVRSSADVSAALRQGLVVLVTHPRVWGNAFAKSLKSFGSEQYYQAAQTAIHSDPLFPLFEKWKVPFTDIGGKVANTEEAFIGGQAAEHLHELPGIKGTPLAPLLRPASNVIRRSDRAFTGFQNEARFEMAKMLAEKASLLGHDLNDEHLGTSIGKVVGTFTGRGVTPKILEGHLTTLNALMFSPRLMAARLNLLSPVYYAKLDPFARAEAMAGARNLVAAIGTVMFIAKTLGAEVNFDPRSSNFTKIKIGNTRIDIAGGFSQYVRFVAQEMTREAISSSGNKSHIGWGQTDISDLSNLGKLARSKAAPIPSLAWDETSGKDFIGQPIKQGHEAWSNAPFVAQDTRDAFKQSGSKSAIVDAFLSAIGLGVQSYKDKPPGSTGNQTIGGGEGYWGGGATSGGQGYWGP